jgi:putative radical SAM enzyme (TIGR03279 family)
MKIVRVDSDSVAARAGLMAGDEILAINGAPLRDALDFLFASAEEELELAVRRADGAAVVLGLVRSPGEPLGIELPPDPIRRCGNRCVFCFIDQNPKGLRRSLYVKDEDYRHSLLFGNYLTLTDLAAWEIERILDQHMSPLYVSVHATDATARRRLLRCPGDGAILPLLTHLARGGIELHAQIVLVPGYNDGEILTRTLDDLERLHPALLSVAIVPVGLTRHRAKLPPLRPVRADEAASLVEAIGVRQRACRARLGTRLHFLADEFYLLAGAALPPASAYEGFPQIENGVGMVRRFERDHAHARRLLPAIPGREARTGRGRRTDGDAANAKPRVLVTTGTRFSPLLEAFLARRLRATGEASCAEVRVIAVENAFFGPGVTTAGLLTGGDILAALMREQPFDLALLPPETLNADGRLLDDLTPDEIGARLGAPVRVGFAASTPDANEADAG